MAVKFQAGKAVPAKDVLDINEQQYNQKRTELQQDYLKAYTAIDACLEDLRGMYRIATNMRDVNKGDRLKAKIDKAVEDMQKAKQNFNGVISLAAQGA
jgi:hypothetical protein